MLAHCDLSRKLQCQGLWVAKLIFSRIALELGRFWVPIPKILLIPATDPDMSPVRGPCLME